MSDFGSWSSVLAGLLMLIGTTVARLRAGAPTNLVNLWNAMSLIGFGMIIGPLPWAFEVNSDTIRIGASAISILASLAGIAFLGQWIIEGARRLSKRDDG